MVVVTVVLVTVVVGAVVTTGNEVDECEAAVGAGRVPDALLVVLPPHAVRATLRQAARTQSLAAGDFIDLPLYEQRPFPDVPTTACPTTMGLPVMWDTPLPTAEVSRTG